MSSSSRTVWGSIGPQRTSVSGGRRRAVEMGGYMKEAAMARVRLRDILSPGDRAAVMGLRRGPGQDQYLNSMEEIFAEADEEQRAMPHPWAMHDAQTGTLVGFAMISDNIPPPIDDNLVGPRSLWKLLIDHRFQRRGYGAATLDAIVDYLATRPGATCSTPAAPTAPARRAGSTSATASPTPAGSCGARTSSRSTSRREADWGSPRSPPPAWTCADHPHLRASVDEHERCSSHPERRECARRPGRRR